ncbi:hypothetical protein LPTSP4_05470 [Leptospira ryugenii]|uniref:Uncharacterized protein n=1 Tax=Leptospira ryugenii TaxID=1917863 RepID=A0A2P2DWM3_9LEPT|nr:hypothetical protein [Leptospira ryugenii]GBF49038.1 hypothetical protein LPTSP4_05470 [Leptospira ryugenii]
MVFARAKATDFFFFGIGSSTDIHSVISQDESLQESKPAIFQPYQHHDFYGLDSLFLSPLQVEERWNLQNVPQIQCAALGFLTLRSFLAVQMAKQPVTVYGLSPAWKAYLGKTQYFRKNPNLVAEQFVPEMVDVDSKGLESPVSEGLWEQSMYWAMPNPKGQSIFFVATGRLGESENQSISETLGKILKSNQEKFHLEKAYIRKESNSYLFIHTKEQVNPRVFYKEAESTFPEFILLCADLVL